MSCREEGLPRASAPREEATNRDTLGNNVKIVAKTADDLADEALLRELAESGALDSPGIYTVEDLEADDAELRAQGK